MLQLGDVSRLDGNMGMPRAPIAIDGIFFAALVDYPDAFERKIEQLAGIVDADHRSDFVLITAKAENCLAAAAAGSTPADALRFEHDDFQAGFGTFDRCR